MRKFPLTIKIWLALSLVSLLLYIIFLFIVPFLIRNFFTTSLLDPSPALKNNITRDPLPSHLHIRQFIMLENGRTIPARAGQMLPKPLLLEISRHTASQQHPVQRYDYSNGQVQYRYVIRKFEENDRPLYQISFLKRSDEESIVQTLLLRLMLYAGIALIISWFASLFIARYLTRPLIKIEQHVKRIANRSWHEPLHVKQKDELGQLAHSIENMRRQLVRQEETQQSMLQNISHELKTPIMVIRSYAQAMQDGVYPKGDLAGSIQVIDEEGARLEKLVKQLLYLTRLDYQSTQNPVYNTIHLHELFEKIVERLRYRRPEVKWELDLHPVDIEGDEEQWRVLIENILDNHLRYASSNLHITLAVDKQENEVFIRFWNDGSKVEPHILEQLFQPFQKGREGKFGLGLTIVQRIVKMYQGEISVYNENNGVCTIVKIPLNIKQ